MPTRFPMSEEELNLSEDLIISGGFSVAELEMITPRERRFLRCMWTYLCTLDQFELHQHGQFQDTQYYIDFKRRMTIQLQRYKVAEINEGIDPNERNEDRTFDLETTQACALSVLGFNDWDEAYACGRVCTRRT